MAVTICTPCAEKVALIYPVLDDRHKNGLIKLGAHAGISGFDVLLGTVKKSRYVAYAESDGEPLAVAGVIDAGTALAPVGALWMAVAPNATRHWVSFLRLTKENIERWANEYTVLVDYIPVERKDTLRWLRWMGFEILPPVPNNIGGLSHPVEYKTCA